MNSKLMATGIILLATFGLFSGKITAQNYEALKPDASYYFYDSTSMQIIAERIDSIAFTGNETHYYAMRQIRWTDYSCFTPDGASWMGNVVTEKPNGEFQFKIFPFSAGDSNEVFIIKSKAVVGENWHFYNYHSINHYVEATVTQTVLTNFIGISDSVKIITLQRKNASGQNVSDPVNGQKLLLSKNYGLVRFPKFDEFNTDLKFLDLCGKTNPETGITNLKFRETFDFQPGDEFHIIYDDIPYVYFYPKESGSIINHIIERIALSNDDTLCYKIAECKSITHSLGMNQTTIINTCDTIIVKYINTYFTDLEFDPKEPFFNLNWTQSMSDAEMGMAATDFMNFSGIPWKYTFAHGYLVPGYNPEWQCWQQAIIDNYTPQSYYYKGLGGPYYSRMAIGPSWSYRKLVYYKKGSETWGTPLDCQTLLHVGQAELIQNSEINIYPNPSSDFITISVPERIPLQGSLELYDVSGRKVVWFTVNQHEQTFDLSDLPAGLYSFRLTSSKGEVFRGKIIRQ